MRVIFARNSGVSVAPEIRIASPENEIAISRGFLSRISTRRRVFSLRDQRNGASKYQPCDTTVDSKLKLAGTEMEATAGIEPADKGFADLCLTTWLRRPGKRGESSERLSGRQYSASPTSRTVAVDMRIMISDHARPSL